MAKIELEGNETDETELPQKVVKAKPGKPSAAPLPRKKRVAPIAPLRPVAKKPVDPAEQPEEMLTAEEWADRLKAEEEAKQQEAHLEKEAEEQEGEEENKLMTKEEFLAYMQKEGTKEKDITLTTQNPVYAKRGFSLMDRLSANINEALGVIPNPPKSNSAAVAMPKPIIKETVSPAAAPQQDSDDSQEIDSSLQEITGRASSNWMGLKSNPVLAGVVVLGGLILTLVGTFISRDVLAAVVLEIIGLLVFIFGMVFVFGHVRKMVH